MSVCLIVIQININGFVTFDQPYPYVSWWPEYFPIYYLDIGMIAPFWTDIDLRPFYGVEPGSLFYQCYSRSYIGQPLTANEQEVFNTAQQTVQDYYGDYSFEPTMVCVITWWNVQPYPNYFFTYQVMFFEECNVF